MEAKRGEKWVYTKCANCYGGCAMKVKVVDGVIVKAEGVPNSDFGSGGGLCGKGTAAIMDYYDPNRVNYPVKRTNPKKGLNEDPGWERISWDEALDTIAEKLKAAKAKDVRRVAFTGTPMFDSAPLLGVMFPGFFISFGTPNFIPGGVGTHCGAASHEGAGLFHASWSVIPDYRYCNYVLQFGSNKGTGSGHSAAMAMRQAAEARARGMKFIVFDPICNFSGGKATEWYPILPATDCAVVLSICNLIVNEIGIYDKDYLRNKTNASYLAGADKKFVRTKDGKPQLWDETDGKAKTYDDPTLSHPAIEGEFTVNGVKCRPAFQLMKEHLKQYDPAWASKISTVPENIIRRVAREFVDEAKIGATIEIEGVKLPYRPAAAVMYKGGQGHQNGFSQYMAMMLLNALVGNQEAVGGASSWPARSIGFPETNRPRYEPSAGPDGYIVPGMWYTGAPWPKPRPQHPQRVNLNDLFPHAPMTIWPYTDDWAELWEKAGHPYDVDVVGNFGGNVVKNASNPDTAARFLGKVPFFFSISTAQNETTEGFADIVLPDCHFLESGNPLVGVSYFFNYPTAMDNWFYHVRMPAVEPAYERREALDILFDLADRAGFRKEYNSFLDNFASMRLAKWGAMEVKAVGAIIKPEEKLSCREFSDRLLKFLFGPERGWEWFKENGFITWKKKPEEAYWRWFINARAPVYFEFLEHDRQPLSELAEKIGIHMDWQRYTPLVSYFPSILYTQVGTDSEYDMVAFSFKDIAMTGSVVAQNPWMDEVNTANPYIYNLMMNIETAKKKGLKEGDIISLENPEGDKVTGKLKLMKGIHPQTVGCCGHLGSWAKAKPIARGKGVNMNTLLRLTYKHLCPITLAPETAARVKVYKAGG